MKIIGVILVVLVLSDTAYGLAPVSRVYEIMLDSVFPAEERRKVEGLYNSLLAKTFTQENLKISDNLELTYDDSKRLGLVAGVIEYRDKNKPEKQPGGILVLSDTPLLSRDEQKEYWFLWENSEEFRLYERNKIKGVLDILHVDYYESSDGNLIYLSPKGLKVWHGIYNDLEKIYRLALNPDKNIINAVDNIGLPKNQRTKSYKEYIGSLYLDFCRIYLLDSKNPVPLMEVKIEPILGGQANVGKMFFNSFYIPVLLCFMSISLPRDPVSTEFDAFRHLPEPLHLELLSLFGDWRISCKKRRLIKDDIKHMLFKGDYTNGLYWNELYEYYVRNNFGRMPFENNEGFDFCKGLKKFIEAILGGQLSEIEKASIGLRERTELDERALRGEKVSEKEFRDFLSKKAEYSAEPAQIALDILEPYIRRFKNFELETLNKTSALNLLDNIRFGNPLLSEIDKIEGLLQPVIYRQKELEGVIKDTEDILGRIDLLKAQSQEPVNPKKIVKDAEFLVDQTYSRIGTVGLDERRRLIGIVRDCKNSLQDEGSLKEKLTALSSELNGIKDKLKAGMVEPLKERIQKIQRTLVNSRMFAVFHRAGLDSGGEKTSFEYMWKLTQENEALMPAFCLHLLKYYVRPRDQGEEAGYEEYQIRDYEDFFTKDPEADFFKIIFDGDNRLFRTFLAFLSEYPDGKRKELIGYLFNTFKRSDLNKPYAGLILAFYYMQEKISGRKTCPSPESGFTKEEDVDSLIYIWLRNTFKSLPLAVREREKLYAGNTPYISGYYPKIPKLLQETHRLQMFLLNMFCIRKRESFINILRTENKTESQFAYELRHIDVVIESMLNEPSPDWEIISTMFMFKAVLPPAIITDDYIKRENMYKLIKKGIPDGILESFLLNIQTDKPILSFIWAEIMLEYIEKNKLKDNYPKSINKLKEMLGDRSETAIHCQIPYLAQWHFVGGNIAKGIEALDVIISELRKEESSDKIPSVFMGVDLDAKILANVIPEVLQINLIPYIFRLDVAYLAIAKYVDSAVDAWLVATEGGIPKLDIRAIPDIDSIEWNSPSEKGAVLELMERTKFANLYFLEDLIRKIEAVKAKIIYEMPPHPGAMSAHKHYEAQFRNSVKELDFMNTKFITAAEGLGLDLDIEVIEPKTPNEGIVLRYKNFVKKKEELESLAKAEEDYNAGRYVSAKESIEKVSIPLPLCPNHVNNHVAQLKENIESELIKFEKDSERLTQLLDVVTGSQTGGFANIREDIEFLRRLSNERPDLLGDEGLDYKDLIKELEGIERVVGKKFDDVKQCLINVLEYKVVSMQDWFLLREGLEEIRKIDTRTLVSFFSEAEKIFMERYAKLYPFIKDGLFGWKKPHSIMNEETFAEVRTLAFISRELYGYIDRLSNSGAIESKIPKLYEVQSASHAAVIMQKIKVSRLFLTLLVKSDELYNEKFRDIMNRRYCLYSKRPEPYTKFGSRTRVILDLENLPDFAVYIKGERRLEAVRKLFHAGGRVVFAGSEEKLEEPDKYILPAFEIIDVTQEGIIMECVNIKLFDAVDVKALVDKNIAEKGLFSVQRTFDIIARLDFLNSLWKDMESQKDKLDIIDKKEKSTVRIASQPKGKIKKFREVQILKDYNNDPDNLINALLGLSTLMEPRSKPITRYPVIDELAGILNESQCEAVSHICGSVMSEKKNAVDRVSFIQGPGGCGKTHALAELCRYLFNKCFTICLSAPTHVAVDNMVQKVLETLKDIDIEKQIGRFGSEVDKIAPEIYERCYKLRAELIKDLMAFRKAQGFGKPRPLAGTGSRAGLSEKERGKGHILAFTATGRDGDPEIRKIKSELANIVDVVVEVLEGHILIVDEGGMTGLDQILLLARKTAKAGGCIAIFGDPEQLPPYGLGPNDREKIEDAFDLNGDPSAEYQGIKIKEILSAEWIEDIYATSLLEDRYGKSGTHSFFFNENHRSTAPIVELLNKITYRDDGNEMVSVREQVSAPLTEQLKMFETPDAAEDECLAGRKGQYISINEVCDLLYQMGEDFERIGGFKGEDAAFVSPYKAQIKVFENALILYCLMNELMNAQNGGEFSSFFETDNINGAVDFILGSISSLPKPDNSRAPIFSSEFKEIFINLIAQDDKEERLKDAGRLLKELDTMFKGTYIEHWHYSSKMTLAEIKSIESQPIIEGYGASEMDEEGTEGFASAGIGFSTIHKIQGKEKRSVYVSLVRNNIRGKLGFLGQKLGRHMINTALGRAKDYLRIAFNKRTWETAYKENKTPQTVREYYIRKSAEMVMTAYEYITYCLPKKEREKKKDRDERLIDESV